MPLHIQQQQTPRRASRCCCCFLYRGNLSVKERRVVAGDTMDAAPVWRLTPTEGRCRVTIALWLPPCASHRETIRDHDPICQSLQNDATMMPCYTKPYRSRPGLPSHRRAHATVAAPPLSLPEKKSPIISSREWRKSFAGLQFAVAVISGRDFQKLAARTCRSTGAQHTAGGPPVAAGESGPASGCFQAPA